MHNVPEVGRSSPPSRYRSVDLPHPLGPTIATDSPATTSRLTSSTALTPASPRPQSFLKPRALTTDPFSSISAASRRSSTGHTPRATADPPGVLTPLLPTTAPRPTHRAA